MPTTNTAETAIDPSLLGNLRATCRRMVEERREKLGNGTGGLQEREDLALLYCHAVTLGMDHVTLRPFVDLLGLPEVEVARILDAKHAAARLIAWGRREAGLVG